MISRIVALLLLCTACTTAWGRTEHWSEDAVLHDGRLVTVERDVDWSSRLILTDPFFGLPTLPHISGGWPDKFRLEFKHPDTHKTIWWQGEQHFSPVLLDFVNGVPYLVVYGHPTKDTEHIYGCPELPYIYLQHDQKNWGKWEVIPVEKAPEVLRKANLSPAYPDVGREHLSAEDVESYMYRPEDSSGHFFQRSIPRTYEEWDYTYKNSHRNERKRGDCRPPLQPLADVPLPKPVDIELETLESRDYTPKSADEYYKSLWEKQGTATSANCTKYFRPPSPENLMLGERFVNDPTGNKRLPYSGPSPFPSSRMFEKRTERFCDEKFVWFVAGHEEIGKTIVTKYTTSGDFVYTIRMVDPVTDIKLARHMVLNSFTAENGYFYFYWYQDLPRQSDLSMANTSRMTKFRFREPVQEATSK